MYVGVCILVNKADFWIVVEKSAGMTSSNWDDVLAFLRHVLTAIDAKLTIPRAARVTWTLFGEETRTVLVSEHLYDLERLIDLVNQLAFPVSPGSTQSTIDEALKQARDNMRSHIIERLNGRSTQGQAVIVVKYDVVDGDSLTEAREILQWLTDAEVYVTVVGGNTLLLKIKTIIFVGNAGLAFTFYILAVEITQSMKIF